MPSSLDKKLIADLVERSEAHDRQAQRELIQLTQNRLYKFCFLLGHNKELAEDLTQEVYLKALQNLRQLKNRELFVTWLFQIAKNLFLDFKKSAAHRSEVLTEDLPEQEYSPQFDSILSVRKILSQFEPDDRFLLITIEIEEFSYREMAEIIGASEDSLRPKLQRLRQQFLTKLKNLDTKPSGRSSEG